MGDQAYADIINKSQLSQNQRINAEVRSIGESIAVASGENFDWQFNIIAEDTVNAFCLPGGKVAVYTGILPVAQNSAALAAVMGHEVAHAHLRYVRPFPKNLGTILKNYEHVLIPEINNGQLIRIIRDQYLVDAKGYNKIMGVPITKTELVQKLRETLQEGDHL
ncbi:MAG: hypothetical protein EOP04_08030 [Proteobacteria bacterium]|nr:MAG: hypothetical protein EOP04_08030 [Pseudomonadota bacterium]